MNPLNGLVNIYNFGIKVLRTDGVNVTTYRVFDVPTVFDSKCKKIEVNLSAGIKLAVDVT